MTDVVPATGDEVSFADDHQPFDRFAIAAATPAEVVHLQHLVTPGAGPSTMVFLRTTSQVPLDELMSLPVWTPAAEGIRD